MHFNSRTLIFRALDENKIRKLPEKVFYGLTAVQELWVYRLNFFCTIKSLDDSLIHFEQEISRFLPAFLKSKKEKEKKSEFLHCRMMQRQHFKC